MRRILPLLTLACASGLNAQAPAGAPRPDPQARYFAISLRSLLCIYETESIGPGASDEVGVIAVGAVERGDKIEPVVAAFPGGRQVVRDVNSGDWVVRDANGAWQAWQGTLQPGERVMLTMNFIEHDGGRSPYEIYQDALRDAAKGFVKEGLEGAIIGFGSAVFRLGDNYILKNGENDLLGSVSISVANVDGQLVKQLGMIDRARIGGVDRTPHTTPWAARSRTRSTIRVRLGENAPFGNRILYHASFNVFDPRPTQGNPEGTFETWEIIQNKAR